MRRARLLAALAALAGASFAAPAPALGACQSAMTLDAVTVQADCITQNTDGSAIASGHVRFWNGSRLVVDGSSAPDNSAPLVLKPASHTITPQGTARTLLVAGPAGSERSIAVFTQFVLHTQPQTWQLTATNMLNGVATIEGKAAGADGFKLDLSGFKLLDLAASVPYLGGHSLGLVPLEKGGGVLAVAGLSLPFWYGSIDGGIAVQALAQGQRFIRSGLVEIPESQLPGTDWGLKKVGLQYDSIGGRDLWRGSAGFSAPGFGDLSASAVIKAGRLDYLVADWDGSAALCSTCGATSSAPDVAEAPSDCFDTVAHQFDGQDPAPGQSLCLIPGDWPPTPPKPDPQIGVVLKLKRVHVEAKNLANVAYTQQIKPGTCIVPNGRRCPAPPEIDGNVVMTALGDRILGVGNFRFRLTGDTVLHAHVGGMPLYDAKFTVHTGSGSFDQVANTALAAGAYGLDFGDARLHFRPPSLLTLEGSWTMPITPFLTGNLFFGIDPPHFTGGGGVHLHVPQGSPILAGENIAGADGLISDIAAAASASVDPCSGFLGGCAVTFSGAYLWHSGTFKWFVDIDDYRTVDFGSALARLFSSQGRRAKPLASPPVNGTVALPVPPGSKLAIVTVRSRFDVPQVELSGASVRRAVRFTSSGGARDPFAQRGAVVSVSPATHQVMFLVARPDAGTLTVKRVGGPLLTSVQVGTPAPRPSFQPAALAKGTLRSSDALRLGFRLANAPAGTTVDVFAGRAADGAPAAQLVGNAGLAAQLDANVSRLPTGTYRLYAVIKREGIPIALRPWPGTVRIVDEAAPRAPGGKVQKVAGGAIVTWPTAVKAASYLVTATPLVAGAAEPVEDIVAGTSAGTRLALLPGVAYRITVEAVDRGGHTSAERVAGTIDGKAAGGSPPYLVGRDNLYANVGTAWTFTPVADDVDGGPVSIRLVAALPGMSIAGRTVRWTPPATMVGERTFQLAAVDSSGKRTVRSFTVNVNRAGVGPAFAAGG